jgi:ABC-2 type transport system ATP-binding protein
MTIDPPLSVENLSKIYGTAPAVQNISFAVHPGEVIGLLGPNGSGKSTTLHAITGLVLPTKGQITLSGLSQTMAEAKNYFGFLPDDLPGPGSLRAREIIGLHQRLRPAWDESLVESLLDLLGLRIHLTKYYDEYSHGMKRKLSLVLALAHRPRLLILDEPMRGLDPEAEVIMSSLINLFRAQGGAVLLATHDLGSAATQCDRVVILAQGKLVAEGKPADLVDSVGAASLSEFFINITWLTKKLDVADSELRQLSFFNSAQPIPERIS